MSDEISTKAIRDRIEMVAEAMRLNPEAPPVVSASDIESALSSDAELVAFAQRHGVSIDYLRTADLRPMISAFKELQRRELAVQEVSSKMAARRDAAPAIVPGTAPQLKRH